MISMFLNIFDTLTDKFWNGIREVLQGWVLSNLESILDTINERTATVSDELAKTPDVWNSDIWSLILKIAVNDTTVNAKKTFRISKEHNCINDKLCLSQ